MATRGLTAPVITALADEHVEFYSLVRMDFTVPLYYTNAPYDINYDGNDYISNPLISKIPDIKETLQIKPNTISLVFGGADIATHTAMLGDYTGVDVYIYTYLPSITTGFLKWQGIIDSASSSEDLANGKSTITWKIANHWSNWEAKNLRLLNNEYQQKLFPGDLGLEFVGETAINLEWWGTSTWNPNTSYTHGIPIMPMPLPNPVYSAEGIDETEYESISIPTLYGYNKVKGIPVFRSVYGVNNKYMFVVYVLSNGECDSLVDVVFFDEEVSVYTFPYSSRSTVVFHSGSDNQTVDTLLESFATEWTVNHRLRGICYVMIAYEYDDEVWRGGEPDPTFIIQGKKVYDPRDSLTKYSTNPALILNDYLTSSAYGKGLPQSIISGISDGATYADITAYDHDNVATQTLIPKFEFNGVIDTKQTIKRNVEYILFAMFGHLPWSNGVYNLVIERDDDSSIFTFDDNVKDVFDVNHGKRSNFISYSYTDFNAESNIDMITVDVPAYLTADNNRELKLTITNKYEQNRYRSINRATSILKKSRENKQVKLTALYMDALQLMPGNIISITRATQGWVNKTFRIEEMTLKTDGDIQIDKLSEYEPTVYDWSVGTEYIPPDSPTVLDPTFVPPPTGLTVASGTDHLLLLKDGSIISRAYITWTAPNEVVAAKYELEYKRPTDAAYTAINIPDITTLSMYSGPVEDGVLYEFRIKALNSLGVSSTWETTNHLIIGKTEIPSDVTNFSSTTQDFQILLSWNLISDLDRDDYEIRKGTVWSTADFIARVKGTEHLYPMALSGTHDFMIKAYDTSGNQSGTAATTQIVITSPAQPSLSSSYDGPNFVISWTTTLGSFPISGYEIRKGASWAAGEFLATIKSTTYSVLVDWTSTETLWVAAIDQLGNVGTPGSATSLLGTLSAPIITVSVVDNNVLLRWSPSSGTLPVVYYEIRRGPVFSSAEVLQNIFGTFAAFFENQSGNYIYWVVGVDSAGNYGTEQSINAYVDQPPDYILNINWLSTFSGTKTNAIIMADGGLLVGVNTTETFQQHFVNNSWDQPQDQITAGYDYYMEPSTTSASYEETFDYGATLDGTLIKVNAVAEIIDGSVTPTYTISTKLLIGDPWDDNVGVTQIYATNFRYVKVKIDYSSIGNDDLLKITSLNVVLDSKLKNDSGMATAVSTDSGGTTVNFNVAFVDVSSIILTAESTTAATLVYDFIDIPNPTSFSVYAFNASGARITTDFSWTVRGF